MLHSPTPCVSTQPVYIARGCVHPQLTLNHANVTETPEKSVNRCRKSLVCNELYLQTGFGAGLHGWVGLCRYLTQPQGRQEVENPPTQSSPRPLSESVNRHTILGHVRFITCCRTKELGVSRTTQAVYRRVYRLAKEIIMEIGWISLHSRRPDIECRVNDAENSP